MTETVFRPTKKKQIIQWSTNIEIIQTIGLRRNCPDDIFLSLLADLVSVVSDNPFVTTRLGRHACCLDGIEGGTAWRVNSFFCLSHGTLWSVRFWCLMKMCTFINAQATTVIINKTISNKQNHDSVFRVALENQ